MVPFALGQYWEMSSIRDCPLKSFYFGIRKEGFLNFKVKKNKLDLEGHMQVNHNEDFVF